MEKQRQTYAPEFKLKVVLESYQRDTTQEEVCRKFGISSSMLHRWRKHFQGLCCTPIVFLSDFLQHNLKQHRLFGCMGSKDTPEVASNVMRLRISSIFSSEVTHNILALCFRSKAAAT